MAVAEARLKPRTAILARTVPPVRPASAKINGAPAQSVNRRSVQVVARTVVATNAPPATRCAITNASRKTSVLRTLIRQLILQAVGARTRGDTLK